MKSTSFTPLVSGIMLIGTLISIEATHAHPFDKHLSHPVFQPQITLSADTVDFGEVYIGEEPSDSVGITNNGSEDLIIEVKETDPGLFLGDGMTIDRGKGIDTLAAGETKVVVVRFHPKTAAEKKGSVTITHNAANVDSPQIVWFVGTSLLAPGELEISIGPDTLAFGDVEVTQSVADTVTITNTGAGTITGAVAIADDFLRNAFDITDGLGNFTLVSGAQRRVIVSLKPGTVGLKQSHVSITHNASNIPSPRNVVVTGYAIPTTGAEIELDPPSHDFGEVAVGENAETTILLKSTGEAQIRGSVRVVDGFSSAGFLLVAGEGGYVLDSGTEKVLQIRFSPVVAGAVQSKLRVFHNAPEVVSPLEVALTGSGFGENLFLPPTLISPEDAATDVAVTPTFVWRTVQEAESYRIRVSRQADLGSPVLDRQLADTSATGIELAENTVYHWGVTAIKETDTAESEIWSFTTMAPENTNPVAENDSITVARDIESALLVLGNDTDADGDALVITGISNDPINGSASFTATEIRYTPITGFLGNDLLSYTISDGNGGEDEATVYIRVAISTDAHVDLPEDITALYQNFPNPFSQRSTILFSIESDSDVELVLLDVLGRTVKRIAFGRHKRGGHSLQLDSDGLTNGTYVLRMKVGEKIFTRQISVVQ